jgi:hypothetical protein
MSEQVRHELRIFSIYFMIAFVAEMAGFIGWMNEMTRDGTAFQLSNVFWIYELSRLRIWLPVFLGLSALRLAIFLLARRSSKSVSSA